MYMDLPRPIQLLVHNVTHSDVVIDCESPTFRPRRDDVRCLHRAQRPRRDPLETATASSTQTITIRPKFNAFLRATSDLLERLESVTKLAPVRSPYRSPASAERTTTGFTIPASSSTFGTSSIDVAYAARPSPRTIRSTSHRSLGGLSHRRRRKRSRRVPSSSSSRGPLPADRDDTSGVDRTRQSQAFLAWQEGSHPSQRHRRAARRRSRIGCPLRVPSGVPLDRDVQLHRRRGETHQTFRQVLLSRRHRGPRTQRQRHLSIQSQRRVYQSFVEADDSSALRPSRESVG